MVLVRARAARRRDDFSDDAPAAAGVVVNWMGCDPPRRRAVPRFRRRDLAVIAIVALSMGSAARALHR